MGLFMGITHPLVSCYVTQYTVPRKSGFGKDSLCPETLGWPGWLDVLLSAKEGALDDLPLSPESMFRNQPYIYIIYIYIWLLSYNLPPPNLLQYINLYNPFASGRFLQPLDNLKYDNQGNFGGQHFLSPWFDIHQSPQTKVDSESSISKNPSRICFPVCSPEFIDEAWWTTNCAWVPPTLILASTASSSLSVSDLLPSCRRSMWVWHFSSDRTYRT